MPSKYDEQRFQAARLRLSTHPALETAPKDPYSPLTSRPELLSRLLAQIDARSDTNNITAITDPRMLADKGTLEQITSTPSLADKNWRTALANGCNNSNTADIMDREKLADIVAAQPSIYYQPGADAVEEALVCAVSAQISLAEAREKCRETKSVIEKEIAAKEAAAKARAFPREWANLKPPATPSTRAVSIVPATASKAIVSTAQRSSPEVNRRVQEITAANQRTTRSATAKAGARCCFCPEDSRGRGGDSDECDSEELLGPFVNSRGKATLYVHFNCGCWAPQVFADPRTSVFRGVYDEYKRGRQLRCTYCKQKGATVGCYIEKCKKVFHYRCLEKAKARKVNEYFAAFCRNHAHLADKESYQLMMKAHTIADVAAAHRESTDGLDAPHSKYTKLRRRDTEIIFSRKARLCSHSGAFDHGKSLYSTASRTIVTAQKTWKRSDGIRLIRNSTVNVANGYLALLVSGKGAINNDNDTGEKKTETTKKKPYSPLFLLRNLENAPDWNMDHIRLAKPTRRRSVHFNIRMRKSGNRAVPMVKARKSDSEDNRGGESDAAKDWGPVTPRRKRTASDVEASDTSEGRRSITRRQSLKMRKLNNGASVPLPKKAPKNYRLSGTCRLQGTGPIAVDADGDSLVGPGGTLPSGSPTSSIAYDGTPQQKRTHCGWDIFLSEQLPRERLVRPDDDMDVAMNNMARMWSLLSKGEREDYDAKAKGKLKDNAGNNDKEAKPELLFLDGAKWSESAAQHQSVGLFAVKSATPVVQRNRNNNNNRGGDPALEIESKNNNNNNNSAPASVALSSRRNRRWRKSARRKADDNSNNEAIDADVDWDDMFPIDLTTARPSAVSTASADIDETPRKGKGRGKAGVKRATERIRPPPRTRG